MRDPRVEGSNHDIDVWKYLQQWKTQNVARICNTIVKKEAKATIIPEKLQLPQITWGQFNDR